MAGERRGAKRIERETERQCDRVPDIVRYNENMAATWKSPMALL